MSLARSPVLDVAAERIGDVLQHFGAKLTHGSTPERGRATCPVHQGDSFSLSFSNGKACCFSGCGRGWDSISLVMEMEKLDFFPALKRLGDILGEDVGPPVRREEPSPPAAPRVNAAALWAALPRRNEAAEKYLRGRRLIVGEAPLSDLVRFNVGASGNPWLDRKAEQGYRVAFPVRSLDGDVRSLSLRFVGDGEPPDGKKALALLGCSTSGLAICRPEIHLLALGDPEFTRDEVLIVEGGPDALAATLAWDASYAEGETAPTWVLGAVGAWSAAGVVRAFAPVCRWRTVLVGLDVDEPGDVAAWETIDAAREVGARRALRLRPTRGKDLAEWWAS